MEGIPTFFRRELSADLSFVLGLLTSRAIFALSVEFEADFDLKPFIFYFFDINELFSDPISCVV